ncbi:MAG: DUF1573 domain-containing protein [Bacteroidaceae bacterium]|nr:DUF1573 domain-containing protein [Bacteroidaceae bacterium]
MKPKFSLVLLFLLLFVSCKKSDSTDQVVRIVSAWQGKEVLFPNNPVFTIYGQDTVSYNFRNADYKVVSYVDSVGCLSCKLQLDKWTNIIHRIDSVADIRVPFVFVFSPEKLRDVVYATKSSGFDYPILLDMKGEFNNMNHFPTNFNFQTMLLDRDNRVVAIGNPVQSPKTLDLFQSIITGQEAESETKASLTTAELDISQLDFGELSEGVSQQRIVNLKNTGNKPLIVQDVVVSCGCTKVKYPQTPIMPGETGEVVVSYDPDKKGGFHKTVTLYCNAKQSPLKLSISGRVV